VRNLRNTIHANCWQEITKEDVEQARLTVIGVYHVVARCQTRVAEFQPAADTLLSDMEQGL